MNKNSYKIAIILLLSVLIILNLSMRSNIQTLNQNVHQYGMQIRSLESQLTSLQSTMNEEAESKKLVAGYDIDYEPTEGDDLQVSLEVTMNQIEAGAGIKLYYRAIEPRQKTELQLQVDDNTLDNQWYEIDLYNVNGLIYSGRFIGKKFLSYELRVEAMGSSLVSGQELGVVDPIYRYYPQLDGEISPRSWSTSGEFEYSANLHVFSETKVEPASVLCEVLIDGELADSVDMMSTDNGEKNLEDEGLLIWYDMDREFSVDLLSDRDPDSMDILSRMIVTLENGDVFIGEWSW